MQGGSLPAHRGSRGGTGLSRDGHSPGSTGPDPTGTFRAARRTDDAPGRHVHAIPIATAGGGALAAPAPLMVV